MTDFLALSKAFRDLMETIGIQKEEIEGIVSEGPPTSDQGKKKKESALDKLDSAMENLRKLMSENEITAEERKRRITELDAEIKRIDLLKDFETDFEERMRLNRKLSRLHATLGTWETMDVFHFETLLDPEGQDFRVMLEEADKDIKARRNLQRVLKGAEIALRVGAFGAALAAKMAVATVA
jgi:hypothetical protein